MVDRAETMVDTWEDHGARKRKQAASSFWTEIFIASLIHVKRFDFHQISDVCPDKEN